MDNPKTTSPQIPKSRFSVAAPVIGRALAVSLVLGTVLTVVNQTAAVFGNAQFQLLPLIMVFLTPFGVVAYSQILGMRAARQAAALLPQDTGDLLSTAFSHGIPKRAIVVGVTAAGVNSAIVMADLINSGQELTQLPIPLLLQALTLPIVFGALSQAISFRRALQSISKAKPD